MDGMAWHAAVEIMLGLQPSTDGHDQNGMPDVPQHSARRDETAAETATTGTTLDTPCRVAGDCRRGS